MKKQVEKLRDGLRIAHIRVIGHGIDDNTLEFITNELIKIHGESKINDMLKYISMGSRGVYGRSLRFTFQEINFWIINENLKDKL